MPSIYEIKQNTADKLLDIALDYNKLKYYLLGVAGYELTVIDTDGSLVISPELVMGAIYKKYTIAPEIQIDKKVCDTLSYLINRTKDGSTLLTILSEIEYQMLNEKENRAPFTMDCSKLLQDIKENIARNYSLYQKTNDINKDGFIGEFKHHDRLLQESYNQKIL